MVLFYTIASLVLLALTIGLVLRWVWLRVSSSSLSELHKVGMIAGDDQHRHVQTQCLDPVDGLQPPDIELCLGDRTCPAARIAFAGCEWSGPKQQIPQDSITVSRLNAALHGVPAVFAGLKGADKIYHVTLSPKHLSQLGKTLKWMGSGNSQVAAAINKKTGKVVELGKLWEQMRNPSAIVSGLWAVAAVVTAQKFLSDINKQLTGINDKLNSIRGFLEDQQWGSMLAARNYLLQLAHRIEQGAVDEHDLVLFGNKLEDIELDSAATAEAASLSAERNAQRGPGEPLWFEKVFAVNSYAAALRSALSEQAGSVRVYLAASYVRALATEIRSVLPLDQSATRLRVTEIGQKVHAFTSSQYDTCGPRRTQIGLLHYMGPGRKQQFINEMNDFLNNSVAECESMRNQIYGSLHRSWQNAEAHNAADRLLHFQIVLHEDGTVKKAYELPEHNDCEVRERTEERFDAAVA